MKPYVLGFLCSCFVVSQVLYTVWGRSDPTAVVSAGPTLVWVCVAPIAILLTSMHDHSLRRSMVSCAAAGLCFSALVVGAVLSMESTWALSPGDSLFGPAVVGAAVLAVPLSVGLVSALDWKLRLLGRRPSLG